MLWVMGIWEFASCQAFVWSPGQQPEGNAEKAKNATKKVEKTKMHSRIRSLGNLPGPNLKFTLCFSGTYKIS